MPTMPINAHNTIMPIMPTMPIMTIMPIMPIEACPYRLAAVFLLPLWSSFLCSTQSVFVSPFGAHSCALRRAQEYTVQRPLLECRTGHAGEKEFFLVLSRLIFVLAVASRFVRSSARCLNAEAVALEKEG